MSFKDLDYNEAHKFVASRRDVRWDGWEIVFFKLNEKARTDKDGARYRGRWGFEKRITVNSNGKWVIPIQYYEPARNAGRRSSRTKMARTGPVPRRH